MKKIKFNFFKKLIIYSMTISFTGIAIVQMLNLTFLDHFYIYRKKQEIPSIAREIELLKDNPLELAEYIEKESTESGVQINYGSRSPMGQRGRNLSTSTMNRRNPMFEHPAIQKKVELRKTKSGGRYLTYYEEIDEVPLTITIPLISMENYRYEALIVEFISIFIALIFSFLLGGFFSKKLTENIEKLNIAAKKMAHLEFVEKLNINSQDEIGELATSVEEMSTALKSSMDSLKSFVSNASHELKTPISIINMTSQNLKRESSLTYAERMKLYDILIQETGEMTELIQNLMTLSKITYSKNSLEIEKFNLRNLVKDSIYKYELLELEKDLSINAKIDPDFQITTDSRFFKLALDNLIQNAMKYSPEEGKIDIILDKKIISIKNQTVERVKESPENLLSPFRRGSNSAGKDIEGSGLGLSIVKNVLDLLEMKYSINISESEFEFLMFFR